ncbi:MAG: hypothetical protein PHT53_05680, partial [Candidatus Omnitrophica bacterium]|nr:hypothetical protein [Candidatus Omnitrophota bacterium]
MSGYINSTSCFKEAKNYLDSFVNYEKKTDYSYVKTLKLKRIERLLKSLNIDYKKLKSIHIAGTKGKGSTACFCANLLASAGYRTGLYTSPHFFDFRERIQVLGQRPKITPQLRSVQENQGQEIRGNLISKDDVVRLINEMQPQLEKLRFTKE